jgi:hypothetical protein
VTKEETMELTRKVGALVLALYAAAPASGAGATPAEWSRMKSLVGAWKGTAEGKPVSVTYALVSNGTALMETLDGDHDMTMITMYAPDGASLLATHYCAAGNQPRMRATGSPDGRSLAFEFVDVSGQGTEVMRRLVVTFVDADHFRQTWTSRAADGQEHSSVFDYTRVR